MERRQYSRLAQPFEGDWRGSSGANRCRIGDLSRGGCFVQTLATPTQGEQTVISLNVGEHRLSLPGRVIYVEPKMGFAVKFDELTPEATRALEELLANAQRG